jgi:hypothetical protein
MKSFTKHIGGGCIALSVTIALAGMALAARAAADESARVTELSAFSSAPLCFEAREAGTEFIARGTECNVVLAPSEADIILGKTTDNTIPHQPKSERAVRLQLVGANPKAEMTGCDRMAATANYFVGSDPSKWQSGIPLFDRVQVHGVYPGIQMVYYANQSAQLEYDFLLQPNARPEQIQFRVQGADEVRVDAAGNLVLTMDGQEICQHEPVVFQERAGIRTRIAAGYRLNHDGTVGFALGAYDHSLPLVIDPVLDFLSYIGGKRLTIAWAIALTNGNIYVAGETLSKNLTTTNQILFTNSAGVPFDFTKYQGGTHGFGDAFIASYTTNGVLNYFSYFGGKGDDGALGIAAVGDDSIWITGFTDSRDFPITNGFLSTNVLFSSLTGPSNNAIAAAPADAFIAHVSAGGTNLLFSTYFGGNGIDEGTGIALDANNNVFITGLTSSTLTNFPVTANAFQPTNRGSFDAFVAELVPDGSGEPFGYANNYCTYFGGTNLDYGLGIALDSSDNIWISGITFSTNFYTTNNFELMTNFNGFLQSVTTNASDTNHLFSDLNSETNRAHHSSSFHSDGFVSEFTTNGTLLFSTLLGGSNDDAAVRLTIDSSDHVYVTGYTLSKNFPTNVATGLIFDPTVFTNGTTNVFVGATTNFVSHAFVTELVPGQLPDYIIHASTSLGGNGADRGTSIALDQSGDVYVIGSAGSTNFFITNVVILNGNPPGQSNTNKHGVITNYTGLGILTNNFTFTNLTSTNFTGKLKQTTGNTNDIFIAVLGPGLSNYLESIILGGPGDDEPNAIAVDPSGDAYFVGATTSKTNFATPNAAQPLFPKGRPVGFVGRIRGVQPFP